MSRQRIGLRARHLVGFDGKQHVLWQPGEVVFEGETIVFVGYGHEWQMGRLWSEDYLRRGAQDGYSLEETLQSWRYAFCQLIRGGITTAMPIGSMYYRSWGQGYDEFAAVATLAAELGLRCYLGPCYMSGITYAKAGGHLAQHWDEAAGLAGLQQAERFFQDFNGSYGDLIRGALLPDRIETCTATLLERSAALQRELAAPLRLHCCQSRYEVELVQRLRGLSPVQWLRHCGLLNPYSLLPHGIYIDNNSDLALLAESRASLVHCPLVFARDGEALNSFGRYRKRGINLSMGTDTFPPDMLENLRQGLHSARIKEAGAAETRLIDLYNAATLGGAQALGRDDLGRLSAGAKADIVVFRLGAFHQGPFFDPLKNLISAGRADDCIASFINGRPVMQDGKMAGINYQDLQQQADALFEKQMRHHALRAFGHPPWRSLFHSIMPLANNP